MDVGIGHMSPADKWNVFAARMDPIVACLIFGLGLMGILLRKKFDAARAERVTRGELSKEQANLNEKLLRRCSYAFLGMGTILIVMEFLGL